MKNTGEKFIKATTSTTEIVGVALAVSISWSLHKSILWALLHGLLSWFYVVYYAITR